MFSSNIVGLPVIHIDLATRLGSVREVILDPHNKKVAGLVINLSSGWLKKGVITMENICALGKEALMVSSDQHIYNTSEQSELWELWRKRLDLKGMPLLTTAGEGVGKIWDYDFNLEGNITSLIMYSGFWSRFLGKEIIISGIAIHSFGEDAVILQSDWQIHMETDNTPLVIEEPDSRLRDKIKSTFTRWKRINADTKQPEEDYEDDSNNDND